MATTEYYARATKVKGKIVEGSKSEHIKDLFIPRGVKGEVILKISEDDHETGFTVKYKWVEEHRVWRPAIKGE